MSDYAQITDFSAKDALTAGDPEKIILGSDVDGELDAISTAVATKYDSTDLASQGVAEAGTSNTTLMTPLRARQENAAWVLTGRVIPDGALSTNVPLLNASNTFTGSPLVVNSTVPYIKFIESDGPTDEKRWTIEANAGVLTFRAYNDAESLFPAWLTVDRTGSTVDSVALAATAISLNGVNTTDFARLSQSNTFTANQTISHATSARLLLIDPDTSNTFYVANDNGTTYLQVPSTLDIYTDAAVRFHLTDAASTSTIHGVAFSDYARLSQSNSFTGTLQTISHSSPILSIDDSDAGTDERIWYIGATGTDQLIFQTRTDAGGAGSAWLTAARTGTTVDSVTLAGTTVNLTGGGGAQLAVGAGGAVNLTAGTFSVLGSGETLATFVDDGAVTLYHDNTARLATSGTGVSVTGAVTASTGFTATTGGITVSAGGITVTGNSTITGTLGGLTGLTVASGGASITGDLTTPNTSAAEVGFKGTPQNVQNGNYTLVLTDCGKTIYKASGGAGETITIPANGSVAFPVGTIIRIINNGGGALTIAITTDTLSLAGTGTTGSRTLSDHGVASIEKVATTEWFISGVGLT